MEIHINEITDSELAQRLRNGDIAAGGKLYERYKRNIYFFVVQYVKDEEAAKDIVQQTFMVMIEKISTLQHDVTFKQWLFTIARNESLMILRRKNIVPMEGLESAEENIFDVETPHTIAEQSETKELVYSAIGYLKPAYREVVLLRLFEQLSYEEIAVITNTTVSAVKSKLYKARIILAEKLSPYLKKEK